MKRSLMALAIVVVLAGVLPGRFGSAAERKGPMLAHDVYFTLKDNSPEARTKLVEACRKYLSGHPGTVWFSAGTRAEDLKRDVNDLDFDVALNLVFKDKAAHDQYQTAEKHQKFIEESKPNWKRVRVFDSYVETTASGR